MHHQVLFYSNLYINIFKTCTQDTQFRILAWTFHIVIDFIFTLGVKFCEWTQQTWMYRTLSVSQLVSIGYLWTLFFFLRLHEHTFLVLHFIEANQCKMLLISLSLSSFVSLWTRLEYQQSALWYGLLVCLKNWAWCSSDKTETAAIKSYQSESFLRSILARETSPVNPILTFSCIHSVYVTVSDLCIHDNMTEYILCVCVADWNSEEVECNLCSSHTVSFSRGKTFISVWPGLVLFLW